MDDSKRSEKTRYNTHELLSLNMDRLKEYMKRVAKEASNPQAMPIFEVSPPRARPATRVGKRPGDCRCLALCKDPFLFVEIVSANDKRPSTQRYAFDRASTFREVVERITRQAYDLVVLSPLEEKLPETEAAFGPADLVLLLHGQTRPSDVYFLAKKRWFVMNLVAGADNPEKVENFHQLRDACKDIPFLYLSEDPSDEDAKFLALIRKVRVVPRTPGDLAPLFRLLDELTLGGGL
jgi:hypothetical protein